MGFWSECKGPQGFPVVKFQVFPLLPISHQILVRSHAIFVRFSLNRTLKKGRQKVFLRAGFAENTVLRARLFCRENRGPRWVSGLNARVRAGPRLFCRENRGLWERFLG